MRHCASPASAQSCICTTTSQAAVADNSSLQQHTLPLHKPDAADVETRARGHQQRAAGLNRLLLQKLHCRYIGFCAPNHSAVHDQQTKIRTQEKRRKKRSYCRAACAAGDCTHYVASSAQQHDINPALAQLPAAAAAVQLQGTYCLRQRQQPRQQDD